MTGRVNAVSKENDCFATGIVLSCLLQNVFNCVVETRASAGARATNGFCDHVRSVVALHSTSIRSSNDITITLSEGFSLLDEVDGGVLNVVETKLCRAAGVDQ